MGARFWLGLFGGLLGTACGGAPGTTAGGRVVIVGAAGPGGDEASLHCLPPEKALPKLEFRAETWPSEGCFARADALLGAMTLEEKAWQMLQPDSSQLQNLGPAVKVLVGSVLSGGESDPSSNSRSDWAGHVLGLRQGSLESRLKIPILYGIDAVHGHNNVEGAVLFPHNIGLGCTRNPELVRLIGRATAVELAATGIDWTFSPVVAVVRDERWGRTYESFGETPELASELGAALIQGLQGKSPGQAEPAVLACAKHFLGDGGTDRGVDQGHTAVDRATLERLHLAPYRAAVQANVGTVMASFSDLDGTPMHCHGPMLSDELKGELGFRGFVVSDWRAVERIPGDYRTNLGHSLNAGVDLFMAVQNPEGFATHIQALAGTAVPMDRIDDAVRRILTVKCEQGALDGGHFETNAQGSPVLDGKTVQAFGSEDHRALARQAVRESVVMLQNRGSVVPLRRGLQRIHVAGRNAHDLGHQCGGWTISWQGSSGRPTVGTTLLEAIRGSAGFETTVSYSKTGQGVGHPDAAIAVVGETPYAEGRGDRETLDLSPEDVEVVERLAKSRAPLVVVLVTGRPLILEPVLELADAVLVAWLPGTEGAGVTDVLFGSYPPSGKLGHSWPRNSKDVPLNVGDAGAKPLFPYGFGLTYP